MARKKKNPLGDFEDALSSLGFGGQEGGDSVKKHQKGVKI